MDHVVPLAQGGKSTPGNIVASCKSCNTLKRDMTAVEWLLHIESSRTVSVPDSADVNPRQDDGLSIESRPAD